MKGVQFLVDADGKKSAVQIDLRKHSKLWEDIYDRAVAESRQSEPRESLATVIATIKTVLFAVAIVFALSGGWAIAQTDSGKAPAESPPPHESILSVLRNPASSTEARESAAKSLALSGTSAHIGLFKEAVWQPGLSVRTRCELAVKLVEFEAPEGLEFLLVQYDLYRLERRMTSRYTMDPVREALERLDGKPLLVALEQRLQTERDNTMQNNIRTLMDRVRLNHQPLSELQKLAADTDWKRGMYRRYEAIEQLGRRGDRDLIPFLKSLEPWQSDAKTEAKRLEDQNNFILPEQVNAAIAAIEKRHANAASPRSTLSAATQPREIRVFRGHTAPVRRLTVSPNGRLLVSVAYGHRRDSQQSINEWIVWDVGSGNILHREGDPRKQLINQFAVTSAAFLPDSLSIFRVGRDRTIWHAKTGNAVIQFAGKENALSIVNVSLSPDGKHAVGWWPGVGKVALWDVSEGTERMLNVGDARVVQFLPDHRLLLAGGPNGNRLRTFDIEQNALGDFFEGESRTVDQLRVSSDGTLAVAASKLWDLKSQRLRPKSNCGSCACFAPDNHDLLIAGSDGTVSVTHRDTGDVLWNFIAHRDVILDVAYLPDGHHILTTGGGGSPPYAEEPTADYAIRLWHLPKVSSETRSPTP